MRFLDDKVFAANGLILSEFELSPDGLCAMS
jgi:hypothetical protein